MPLYEYECVECRTRFEKLIYNKETEVLCPGCGSPKINQLLSVFAVGAAPHGAQAPDPGPCGTCSAAQRGMCGMG